MLESESIDTVGTVGKFCLTDDSTRTYSQDE